ncbi:MAG: hypothetical protein RR614_02620 [Eubacterium sp.]
MSGNTSRLFFDRKRMAEEHLSDEYGVKVLPLSDDDYTIKAVLDKKKNAINVKNGFLI